MTVRLIKKGEQTRAKVPEVDRLDEQELKRQARQLAKAWKITPTGRPRRK